ncbi:sulfotransferase [Geminocystis sp.]|uniref:sulfotransferase family protein n=1 Tax=Geminocystis sp. TaxID=2664100 RepID=UPI00359492DF
MNLKENLSSLKPFLRSIKYNWLNKSTEINYQLAEILNKVEPQKIYPLAYIVGCGRSGTTILGNLFSEHPHITYLFEPYHLWSNIDIQTDVLNLFHLGSSKLLMDLSDSSHEAKQRFNYFFQTKAQKNTKLIIEKTPLNALRIGYLETLSPNAKYIHIIRDGFEVSSSIDKLATNNDYKIAGKPDLNQWWGVNYSKWDILANEGKKVGYYSDEIIYLKDNLSKGVYEWLVTLKEMDKWRNILNNNLLEITYTQFTNQPENTLKEICTFLELEYPLSWLNKVVKEVRKSSIKKPKELFLPKKMCDDFNYYQKKYGFQNIGKYQ